VTAMASVKVRTSTLVEECFFYLFFLSHDGDSRDFILQ